MTSDVHENSPPLVVRNEGAVRWLWLNRPRLHNAQNVAMLERFDEELLKLQRPSDVRILVIAGSGPSFSSGHDLNMMIEDQEYAKRASTAEGRYWQELELYARPVKRLLRLPIPTVARVHGHCIGGGVMVAAATDLAVCTDETTFASSILRDLAVNDAEIPTLAWRVGVRRAKELLWLSRTIDGNRAERIGLVNRSVPKKHLDETIENVIRDLLKIPRHALALSKASFDFFERQQGRDSYFDFHFVNHQLTHHTEEARIKLDERRSRIEGRDKD